jgi:hypothetical protein
VRLRLSLIWTAVAIGSGLLVLAGYFIHDQGAVLLGLRLLLMRWAVLVAAAGLIMGLINLLAVHLNKVNLQEAGWPYSALLILFFFLTLLLGLIFGSDNRVILLLFNHFQKPVEASLMGLLAVTLTLAGYRLIWRRKDLFSLVFAGVALVVLVGTGPWLLGEQSALRELAGQFRNWLAQVGAAGGARGILLGVALGAITTGLRVLMGADRPYGD